MLTTETKVRDILGAWVGFSLAVQDAIEKEEENFFDLQKSRNKRCLRWEMLWAKFDRGLH